jgi:hypothetical protein
MLSKKLEAEKAALRLKLLEEESAQCEEEENGLQTWQQKQCLQEEENRSMRQGLVELVGSETLEDHVMQLGQDETRNNNQDNLLSGPEQPLDRQNTTHTIPGTNEDNQVHSVRARDTQRTTNEMVYNPEQANRFRAENTIPSLSQPKVQKETAPTESLLEKMLPT